MAEADLYSPIKKFLEGQGYEVKGEVEDCDIVAVRGDEGPVVVELKLQLNLSLILQAVDRLAVSECVYVAFRVGKKYSASWRSRGKQVKGLLRRLGVGLLTVSARGKVEAVLDPGPYRPRVVKERRARLLKEFAERVGDPVAGGSTNKKRMTSYRQDALRCALALKGRGVTKVSVLAAETGVERAGPILRDNHYGWFERVEKGHYQVTPSGIAGLEEWAGAVASLGRAADSEA
jgi:hypothetical protein